MLVNRKLSLEHIEQKEQKTASNWKPLSVLYVLRARIGERQLTDEMLKDEKEELQNQARDARENNFFTIDFSDDRFSEKGEFVPPGVRIYFEAAPAWSKEKTPYGITFLKHTGPTPELEQKYRGPSYVVGAAGRTTSPSPALCTEEAKNAYDEIFIRDGLRRDECSLYLNKIKSLLTHHQINFALSFDGTFKFDTENNFYLALTILAKKDCLPAIHEKTIKVLAEEYQAELEATLTKLDKEGLMALQIPENEKENYEDRRYFRPILSVAQYKEAIDKFLDGKEDNFEQLLSYAGLPEFPILQEKTLHRCFEINYTKPYVSRNTELLHYLLLLHENSFYRNFLIFFTGLDKLSKAGEVRADKIIHIALSKLTYELLLEIVKTVNCDGRFYYSDFQVLLGYPAVGNVFRSADQLSNFKNTVSEVFKDETDHIGQIEKWCDEEGASIIIPATKKALEERLPGTLASIVNSYLFAKLAKESKSQAEILDIEAEITTGSPATVSSAFFAVDAKQRANKQNEIEQHGSQLVDAFNILQLSLDTSPQSVLNAFEKYFMMATKYVELLNDYNQLSRPILSQTESKESQQKRSDLLDLLIFMKKTERVTFEILRNWVTNLDASKVGDKFDSTIENLVTTIISNPQCPPLLQEQLKIYSSCKEKHSEKPEFKKGY